MLPQDYIQPETNTELKRQWKLHLGDMRPPRIGGADVDIEIGVAIHSYSNEPIKDLSAEQKAWLLCRVKQRTEIFYKELANFLSVKDDVHLHERGDNQ